MTQANKYHFSERGFTDRRPLFAKRRVIISVIGGCGGEGEGKRERERETRGRQGIYDRTGVRFIIAKFAISAVADFTLRIRDGDGTSFAIGV